MGAIYKVLYKVGQLRDGRRRRRRRKTQRSLKRRQQQKEEQRRRREGEKRVTKCWDRQCDPEWGQRVVFSTFFFFFFFCRERE